MQQCTIDHSPRSWLAGFATDQQDCFMRNNDHAGIVVDRSVRAVDQPVATAGMHSTVLFQCAMRHSGRFTIKNAIVAIIIVSTGIEITPASLECRQSTS